MNDKDQHTGKGTQKEKKFPDYPSYPESEDIFNKEKKTSYIPDDQDFNMEQGLDVPGSELDDKDEDIGEEDEENNYYSLGGDNHEDLEETNEDIEK